MVPKEQVCPSLPTSFGWARAYPMKRKSDAHKGFSLLAQHDGVPITIICDNAKEQLWVSLATNAMK